MATPFYKHNTNYVGEVVRQKLGQSSNGNAQLIVTFRIVGEVDPKNPQGDLLSCQGYERTVFVTITENTVDWVCDTLEALGFTGTSYAQFDQDNAGFCDVRGKQVELYCKHEPDYKDPTQQREKWNVSSGKPVMAVKPLDPAGIRKLDALFGKALKRPKPANGNGGTPPLTPDVAKQEATAIPEGDIPF